ncbi:MAG: conjugal transfer protein TraF [Gammaproteobacteria bacterium]|nr:conjugal transfer protein TraF [Gammaproteobacteria bacterium]
MADLSMEKVFSAVLAGTAIITTAIASPALAQDIRTLGMAGAAVSVGTGVGGALANPSLLMAAKRSKKKYHFRFGGAGELRDGADLLNEVDNNTDTLDNIESEIDTLSAQTLTCNPLFDAPETVCLTGTEGLGTETQKALNSFNNISGKPSDGRGGSALAFAVSHTRFPFMVSIGARATAAGVANISEGDKNYAETLIGAVDDNTLSVADILDTASITFNSANNSVDIDSPDDILDSNASGGALLRTSITFGMATTVAMGKRAVDIGVSPRLSQLRAGRISSSLNDIRDDNFDISDEIKEDEVSESSFTFDVGASVQPTDNPRLRIGSVIRNVVPESIETASGYVFESTPQLIVSGAYQLNRVLATADLALNEAKDDNFESQPLSLGAEMTINWFSLRAGIHNDFAVENDPTSFSVGFGFGPVDMATRINGSNVSGGLQIAFSL